MRGHPRKRRHTTKVPQESELPGGVVVTARPVGGLQTPWRTPLASAHGRQHGALIAPKRIADWQPPSADQGRPKKSRRLTAQLHSSIPEGSTPAALLPVHYMSSDSGSPHLDPSMHGKRPRITPARFATFVPNPSELS